MTPQDEQELLRLTGLLHHLGSGGNIDSPTQEALHKAALALSVAFLHNLRGDVERLYGSLPQPLNGAERIFGLGFDPGGNLES